MFADQLTGSNAANILGGGGGADTLNGGKGDDTLRGGLGDDQLNGGAGFDIADYSDATKKVSVDLSRSGPQNTNGGGVDTLLRMEGAFGSAFNDTLKGNSAGNLLDGGAGDDTLVGSEGDDTIDGGAGSDLLTYEDANAGVDIRLGSSNSNSPTFLNIETLIGSDFDDKLGGSEGTEVLIGGAGHDYLEGDGGFDTLTGGDGADSFFFLGVYGSNASFSVTITDLGFGDSQAGRDSLQFSWVDADQTTDGDQAFVLVDTFHNVAAELRIRYDPALDQTFFEGDVDGDGEADLVVIALGDHRDFDNFAL